MTKAQLKPTWFAKSRDRAGDDIHDDITMLSLATAGHGGRWRILRCLDSFSNLE